WVNEPDQLLAQLSSLDAGQGSRSLLQVSGQQPVNEVASFGIDALPGSFRHLVKDNQPARMRIKVDGEPQLVIGIPLPSVNSAYYEFISLDETQRNLQSLSGSLVGAALVTTLAGAALGLWASRRTLRPLADVGVA